MPLNNITLPYQEEWIKILAKGMITIPKNLREKVGIKEGEVAKIKKVGRRLIIEPRDLADFEIYSDKEMKEMLEEDKLPQNLAKLSRSFWEDLK